MIKISNAFLLKLGAAFFVLSVSSASAMETLAPLEKKLIASAKKYFAPPTEVSLSQYRLSTPAPATAEVTILSPQPPMGVVSFECNWNDHGTWKKSRGNAVIRVKSKIAVAKKSISHGEGFSEANVTFAERELSTFAQSGYFSEASEIAGLHARGYLSPGTVLGNANTEAPRPVVAGNVVELTQQKGVLKIVARVKALEGGNLHQWIRVQNPSSGKTLTAQVTGPGEVKLR